MYPNRLPTPTPYLLPAKRQQNSSFSKINCHTAPSLSYRARPPAKRKLIGGVLSHSVPCPSEAARAFSARPNPRAAYIRSRSCYVNLGRHTFPFLISRGVHLRLADYPWVYLCRTHCPRVPQGLAKWVLALQLSISLPVMGTQAHSNLRTQTSWTQNTIEKLIEAGQPLTS